MKTITVTTDRLASEPTLRFDVDYQISRQTGNGNSYRFTDLFELVSSLAVDLDDLTENFQYCEIGDADKSGDVAPVTLNFDSRSMVDENYYKKIENGDIMRVSVDDILISKVRPNLKKFVRIEQGNKDVYFTRAFITMRPKIMPTILYYGLRSSFFADVVAISRQGKGYPTLSENDMLTLQFDKQKVDLLSAQADSLTAQIQAIEQDVIALKAQIKPAQSIIDEVFAREFEFDYAKFEELRTHTRFTIGFSTLANNPDMRFSAKFHRDAGKFVMGQLSNITNKKIKHYLAEPIVLGASVSPGDFDENGSTYYVSMATIKSLDVEIDDTQLLSDSYAEKHQAKTLQKGDILIARSGAAIGKTALVNTEFNGVFADFTMRIRLREYNPCFAYYYIRSTFFQYLIETYKKGLQNTNIFPIVIREFPLPDITVDVGQRISMEIQSEIGKQDNIKMLIADLREKIDDLIEAASAV